MEQDKWNANTALPEYRQEDHSAPVIQKKGGGFIVCNKPNCTVYRAHRLPPSSPSRHSVIPPRRILDRHSLWAPAETPPLPRRVETTVPKHLKPRFHRPTPHPAAQTLIINAEVQFARRSHMRWGSWDAWAACEGGGSLFFASLGSTNEAADRGREMRGNYSE